MPTKTPVVPTKTPVVPASIMLAGTTWAGAVIREDQRLVPKDTDLLQMPRYLMPERREPASTIMLPPA